ncbi:MAG: peptidylprolyl isomerase SurA [Candidatus Baumannia cicadellinicola]|nr:peptidylprolyl isomerase SurA [Candidatus Baumannia cicadellinicola]
MDGIKLLLSIIILYFYTYINCAIAEPNLIDQVVAIVNNDIILESELKILRDSIQNYAKLNYQEQLEDNQLNKHIIDRLIIKKIIQQQAKLSHITIAETKLNKIIHDLTSSQNLSIAKLRHLMYSNRNIYDIYRAQLRQDLLIAEVLNSALHRRITILPQEVEFLAKKIAIRKNTTFNLSHMLIPVPEKPSRKQKNEAEALALFLMAQSEKQNDFRELAIKYSTDTQMLNSFSMIGIQHTKLPLILAKHLYGAQKGSVIGPIYSDIGIHILKVHDMIRTHMSNIPITEVYARHILLRTSVKRNDNQARVQLLNIARKINIGDISFSIVAKQISEDIISSQQGGDLGWNALNAFTPTFRKLLLSLNKGQLSIPVRSSQGWHLIQLQNIRQVENTTNKEAAYRILWHRKLAEIAHIWIQEQRDLAYIKIINHHDNR